MWLRYLTFALIFLSVGAFAQQSITANELLINQMSHNAYTIIDVRSVDEYNSGHLKGAINIPHNTIDEHSEILSKLKSKDLVVYCRSGRRAGLFIDKLTEQGFKLIHLQGDMKGWQGADLPTIKQ
ncbi:rhodanese-like domain-containing protein [Pseudoalteromonas sp. JBTF-M23]|uniref:Rhodanese-like domain-containing protein n=1 Tax=Pseudoalteromonas caenipelagi TaxID=2726988 RepID=A0A849VBY5_9GAMM|nr:rhodanese-like domain-containing protein [Pseudoalteromonas caenipelagi]NOU49211.1 rhodanese-like domain-containing protein [Pseudoalteromonas caenipelagi]